MIIILQWQKKELKSIRNKRPRKGFYFIYTVDIQKYNALIKVLQIKIGNNKMELTADMVRSIVGESEWTKVDLMAKMISQNHFNAGLVNSIVNGTYGGAMYFLDQGANPYADKNLAIRQIMISENLDFYRYAYDYLFDNLSPKDLDSMIAIGLTHSTINGNQEFFTTIVEDFGLSQERKNYYALIGCKNQHLIDMTDYLLANGADYKLIIDNAKPECKEELIRRKELRDLNEKLERELPIKTTITRKIKI